MKSLIRKLIWMTRRREKEAELRDELAFHLSEEAAERGPDGARRELGNVALIEEDTRSAWGWIWLEQLAQDIRYALRAMRHNPTFTALAALSLALGIGANTAIYSFMDAILLRSLPVSDPASLVVLNWHNRGIHTRGEKDRVIYGMSGNTWGDEKTGITAGIFPYAAFEMMQKTEGVFSSVFAYYPTRSVNLMLHGQAEQASGEYVSGDYFRGLEVAPAAGRVVIGDDDRPGAPAIAVLSFAYARHHFRAAASAVGETIRINDTPFEVVGVTPPEFFGIDPSAAPDFYLPMHANMLLLTSGGRKTTARDYLDQHYYWIEVMARLRPGMSIAQAQATLAPQFHQWVASTATNDLERRDLPQLVVSPGAAGLDRLRRLYSEPLYVLLAMVALILAIACANIANLMLARATARRREMAVRLSLGAGRWRVIRQLMTESVMLSGAGGALGVFFALWGMRALGALLANDGRHLILRAEMNWHVLAVAAALSMITGLLFGLLPALQATKVDVMPVLRETRAADRRPRVRFSFLRFNMSHALIVAQIAVSLLMLVATGLFVRTLSNLESISLGFNRENVLLFTLNARQAGHRSPEIIDFYGNLLERFRQIPGVRSATVTNSPLLGEGTWQSPMAPMGKQAVINTNILTAGPDFFSTMQIPILAGRPIEARDQPGSPAVAVVNEVWAKANFGDRNPIGEHIDFWQPSERLKHHDIVIAGLAKNARYGELTGDMRAVVYLPMRQNLYVDVDEVTFALRMSGNALAPANQVREIVHQADSRVPVTRVRTQAAQIDQMVNQQIVFARLCSAFAVLALVIACVGLYGTMAYNVARRVSEIGIRMALGAGRGRVIGMVLGQVVGMVAVGLAIGVPIVRWLSWLVESFLFGVKPNDPMAVTIAVATLVIAALAAGYAPAWRASRIDPMAALRHE